MRKAIAVIITVLALLALGGSGATGRNASPAASVVARTLPATAVTSRSATLNAELVPLSARAAGPACVARPGRARATACASSPVTWYFERRRAGAQRTIAESERAVSWGRGEHPLLVSDRLTDLRADTEYEFRTCLRKHDRRAYHGHRDTCTEWRHFPTRGEHVPPPPAPAALETPTITGVPQVGQVLMAVAGRWSGDPKLDLQWETCDGQGANCAPLPGATAYTYTPSVVDVGHTLRVLVVASNASGSTTATSPPTTAVMALVPSGPPAPVVSGVSPSSGPAAGGTSVTVTGSGFLGASAVRFGGVAAQSFVVLGDGAISATAPVGSGSVDVTVSTPGGTSATGARDRFSYVPLPVVSGVAPSSGPAAGGTSVTVTGSGFSGASAVRFGGASAGSFHVDGDGQITATAPAGSGSVDVTVSTPGGTSATGAGDRFSYVPLPVVGGVAPSSGPAAGGSGVTVTGSGFSGASAVRFGGASAGSFHVDGDGQITATVPAGSGSVDVTVSTPGGTSATGAADRFSYVPLPQVTGVSPSEGPAAGGTSVTITGSGFAGASAVHFGAALASFTVTGSTQITATAPAGSGSVDVTVSTPGGTSATGAGDRFSYVPLPQVTGVSPTSGPAAGGTSVTITGSGFSGASAVRFGSLAASSFHVDGDGQITATAPAGSGSVDVTVSTLGGTSATGAGDRFSYVPLPQVTGLSPTSGPAAGGTSVTITGSGFSGASAVRFGGASAGSFHVDGDGQITATVPAGSGSVDVTVSTPGGTSATGAGDRFSYVPLPQVTGISPSEGPAAGGTSVTITGWGFAGASAVRFGSVAASSFHVDGDGQITATVPAGSGSVDVTVSTPGGTSATGAGDTFSYVPAPVVSGVAPSRGPAAGGSGVTITGSGFSGASAVRFGGVPAKSFVVLGDGAISAVTPPGGSVVDVTVTTARGGTSAIVPGDAYTYVAPASVVSVSPSSGPAAGGTSVTITGSGFADASAVHFGAALASFTVTSSTQITATAPAGSGSVDVTVSTPGGTSATGAADRFSYVPLPQVTGLSPTSGPAAGGTSVTITGSGLTAASLVSFGSVALTPAAFQVNSDTQITATAPAETGIGTVDVTVTTPGGTSAIGPSDRYTYAAAPDVTMPPSLVGRPLQGQTLTVNNGAWNNSPTSFTYVWQRCTDVYASSCTPINGQSSGSYTLGAADVGFAIQAIVTAHNSYGQQSASTTPTALVATNTPPVNLAPPVISGTPQVGQPLSTDTGTWTGLDPSDATPFSLEWRSCDAGGQSCTTIPGATAASYVPVAGDAGHTVVVVVTARNANGATAATSAATLPIAPAAPPVNSALPTVMGPSEVGQVLTTDGGTWTGLAARDGSGNYVPWVWSSSQTLPAPYAYQWQICDGGGATCADVAGATSGWYQLTAAALGHTLRVRVTASNATGATPALSPASPPVANVTVAPVNTAAPTILGTPTSGNVLTVSDGTWTRSAGLDEDHTRSFSYAWADCDASGTACTPVPGATHNWYVLTAGDEGHRIVATVVARNPAGSTSVSSAPTPGTVQVGAPPPPPTPGLHVAGNKLLGGRDQNVNLHGVNRSGTEYGCVQGGPIFDGPGLVGPAGDTAGADASVAAMASWHSNVVRIPINEDCWLGINGATPGGLVYQQAIIDYVNLVHQHGMYAELSLMWGLPGAYLAGYQSGAPDADHSPALWASLANTFRNDPNVILAPWGETTIYDGACFKNGGLCGATYDPKDPTVNGWNPIAIPYPSAGMQQAVDVMRAAGYMGVIAIPGTTIANDLTQWLANEPTDVRGQLIAEAHIYGNNTCGVNPPPASPTQCLDTTVAPVAAHVPVFLGETGDTWNSASYDPTTNTCGSSNVATIMNWADSHGVGYAAWTWNVYDFSAEPELRCETLISDYAGTPANAYGAYVQAHLLSFPAPALP